MATLSTIGALAAAMGPAVEKTSKVIEIDLIIVFSLILLLRDDV